MNVRFDMIACYVVRRTRNTAEFLQLRRAPGKHLGGAWSTVRGKIEQQETAWQAALRELREETGITPLDFFQLDTVDIFYLWQDDTLWHCPGFCALVGADTAVQLNDEHDAWRWTPRQSAADEFLWPGERAQIKELCREILDDGPARTYLRIPLLKQPNEPPQREHPCQP